MIPMKVIVPKNSMAIASKRAPTEGEKEVAVESPGVHETGRFKQQLTLEEQARAELGSGGISRSMVRNEETFG